MYAWKCWRETRAVFFLFLILALAFVGFMDAAGLSKTAQTVRSSEHPGEQAVAAREFLVPITLGIVYAIAISGACLLGAKSAGGELDAGTAEFLFTRPEKRAVMSWTHWGVCAAEIAGIIFVPVMLQMLVLSGAGIPKMWSLAAATPVFLFASLPILGISTLMTAVRRSANSGLIFALGIVLGYTFLGTVLRRMWNIELPDFSSPIVGWLTGVAVQHPQDHVVFPWAAALRVLVLAVTLPVAAQFVLKRAEV